MGLLIHDLDAETGKDIGKGFDRVVYADGRYAPCQGCFHCWTRNPATCDLRDSLQEMCRVIGMADDVTVVTENWYGGYSRKVKNLLDRSIGTSTPFSTYRGGQMHHTLRYGKKGNYSVYVYGDISEEEKRTWKLMTERNAYNEGFASHELHFFGDTAELEGLLV